MKQRKIVIISTVYPFPPDTGKKVVLAGIVSYLCSKFGAENIIYVLIGNASHRNLDLTAFTGVLLHVPKPGILTQLANIIRFVIISGTKSIQESLLYSHQMYKQLESIISTYAPHMIIFDTVRTGQFIEKMDTETLKNVRKILYMEDLYSVRYQKMIDTLIDYPSINMDPLGNYRAFLPPMLASAVQIRPLQMKLLKMEERLIAVSEVRYPKLFNVSLLLNEQEVDDLKRKTNSDSIRSIKPILPRASDDLRSRDYRGGSDFIFLGSLNYPQNQIAIENFISRYMDSVIGLIPSVKLRIIGRGARSELRELIQRYAQYISLDGYIDDIEDVMLTSCAMIVPLLFGSGVKLKTLEAFSLGLPVICTDYGIEGIPAKNGIHCIIENDLSRFPGWMASLCDIKNNYIISKSCQELFTLHYSRSAVSQQYDEIFSVVSG
jgi:glycosyltransferase involved in cell wall biosynthesis